MKCRHTTKRDRASCPSGRCERCGYYVMQCKCDSYHPGDCTFATDTPADSSAVFKPEACAEVTQEPLIPKALALCEFAHWNGAAMGWVRFDKLRPLLAAADSRIKELESRNLALEQAGEVIERIDVEAAKELQSLRASKDGAEAQREIARGARDFQQARAVEAERRADAAEARNTELEAWIAKLKTDGHMVWGLMLRGDIIKPVAIADAEARIALLMPLVEKLKERVEAEHDDATHWPKGSERDGHKGEFIETCPHEDCRLLASFLTGGEGSRDDVHTEKAKE
jgi:hypothetical protein